MEAGKAVKVEGLPNDLIDRIINDDSFNIDKDEILSMLKPENFIGRSPKQVTEFIDQYIDPVLEKYKSQLGIEVEINV